MNRDIDFEDFDSLFNMRRAFWERSREKALTKKERSGSTGNGFQKHWKLHQDRDRKRWNICTTSR